MKKFFLFLALLGTLVAQSQTNVQKNPSGVISNGPVTFGSGNTLTMASGSTLTLTGATVVGFASSYLPLSGVTAGAYTNANITVDAHGLVTLAANGTGGGGSGTVTSVSVSNLALLFTSNVATATTTPAVTFTIANASANTFIGGPVSGSASPLTARALVIADIPSLTLSKISDAGNSASRNVGTTAGTVAAGDDSRIVNAMQTTQNLAGLASTSTSLTNLGATTTGKSFFTTTDPSAIAYPRVNANNSLTYLSAAGLRTDLGLGGAALLNVGTTAGTVMAGDDTRVVGAVKYVTGMVNDGTTDNHVVFQAALTAAVGAGTTTLIIPAGSYSMGTTTIAFPPGINVLGSGDGRTQLVYTGTGTGFTFVGIDHPTDQQKGGSIEHVWFQASNASITKLISASELFRVSFSDCKFWGVIGPGIGFEAVNRTGWTENLSFTRCEWQGFRRKFATTVTDHTITGSLSFAALGFFDCNMGITGKDDIAVDIGAYSFVYFANLGIKVNNESNAALTPTTDKTTLVHVGAAASVINSYWDINMETSTNRMFWRFVLDDYAQVSGTGRVSVAPTGTMSIATNATNPYDSIYPTATFYISPSSGMISGGLNNTEDASLFGAGQTIFKQWLFPSNTALPILYMCDVSGELTLNYTGASRDQTMVLFVSARKNGQGSASNATIRIKSNSYVGTPAFSDALTIAYSTINHNPYLSLTLDNTVSDGKLTMSFHLLSYKPASLSGSDQFVTKPVELIPSLTGVTIGSPITTAVYETTASAALTASALLLGGGTSVITPMASLGTTTTLLHGNAAGAPTFGAIVNGDIANGTIDLGTKVTGNLAVTRLNGGTSASSSTYWRGDGTWAAVSGTGNVTAATSTTGDIMLGAGSGPAINSSSIIHSDGAGNITLTGNITVTGTSNFVGNQTIGNLTTTALTVSGNLTGNVSTGVNGAIYIGETAGHTFSANVITPTTDQTTVTNGANSITIGTVQAIGTTSAPQFSNVRITASTLTFNATTTVDFTGDGFKTETLTGVLTLASSNLATGRSVTIRLIGDSVSRALTFPGGWTFVGAAAPSALAGSKTAILTLTSFGTTDANVVAAYAVQP